MTTITSGSTSMIRYQAPAGSRSPNVSRRLRTRLAAGSGCWGGVAIAAISPRPSSTRTSSRLAADLRLELLPDVVALGAARGVLLALELRHGLVGREDRRVGEDLGLDERLGRVVGGRVQVVVRLLALDLRPLDEVQP